MQKNNGYTVITGASSGIGYQTAKAFAARGSNLILTARRRERLERLKAEILAHHPALEILLLPMDLSLPEGPFRLYEEAKNYPLRTWINNAGFGNYDSVAAQSIGKTRGMLRLNVEALTVLSTLFVRDFRETEGAQLINVSSCGGYTLVPDAVSYCASKHFVSAFTEGLARELMESGARLRAKVFAPAATRTEFGRVANDVESYDYDRQFAACHTAGQAAALLLELYDSDQTVGLVDRETFAFTLCPPRLPYAGASAHNQKRLR